MKKAFTLIELIVVVGILVILIGTLVAALSGGTEAARAARCLTNLKNLATACNAYAMANGNHNYPAAGSFETRFLDDTSTFEFKVCEMHGWLSWDSRGAYEGKTTSHVASGDWFTSAYNTDFDVRQYALTNGALWRYVSENSDVFVCPEHHKKMRLLRPQWSYVMNEVFGYDSSLGSQTLLKWPQQSLGDIRLHRRGPVLSPDRVLMFSELQFLPNNRADVNTDASSGIMNDCTLQYSHNEVIGFNHPNGKRGLFAHIVFADGHTEKLLIPASPSSIGWSVAIDKSELQNLTKWLCEGKDVSFNGAHYEELKN